MKRFFLLLFLPILSLIVFPTDSQGAQPALKAPESIKFKPLSFKPPRATRIILNNGLVVYLLEDHELPVLNLRAVIRAGSMYDPNGQEGLAEITGQVMKIGGVTGMSGDAVDDVLESIAAILGSSTNRDSTSFSLSLMSKDRETGFELFSRIMMKPAFQDDKLSLAKALKTEELRRIFDDPQKLAFREFGRLMHHGSPQGRLATQRTISAIQQQDLRDFHDRMYHPSNVLFAISGDIDRDEVERLMNLYFGTWSSTKVAGVPSPLPRPQQGTIFLIPKEGPQSIVLLGWLAPAKKDPRSLSMDLIDFYAGSGGFRSRIFQEIRTDRGLAYSAGSFYDAKRDFGIFGAYAFTKSESTIEVISLLRSIMGEIAAKPISPQDLKRTIKAIVNSFIFSFTSAEQIAVQQMMLEYEALPPDYLETYLQKMEALDQQGVETVANHFLAPGKAIILVLGNASICEEIKRTSPNVQIIDPAF